MIKVVTVIERWSKDNWGRNDYEKNTLTHF